MISDGLSWMEQSGGCEAPAEEFGSLGGAAVAEVILIIFPCRPTRGRRAQSSVRAFRKGVAEGAALLIPVWGAFGAPLTGCVNLLNFVIN